VLLLLLLLLFLLPPPPRLRFGKLCSHVSHRSAIAQASNMSAINQPTYGRGPPSNFLRRNYNTHLFFDLPYLGFASRSFSGGRASNGGGNAGHPHAVWQKIRNLQKKIAKLPDMAPKNNVENMCARLAKYEAFNLSRQPAARQGELALFLPIRHDVFRKGIGQVCKASSTEIRGAVEAALTADLNAEACSTLWGTTWAPR